MNKLKTENNNPEVEDAEQNCEIIPDQPKIIRQEWNFKDAVKQLENDLQFFVEEINNLY